jgi:hypothetical protein
MIMARLLAIGWVGLLPAAVLYGQSPAVAPTGYLPDAAEEHWPAPSDSAKQHWMNRIKHLPVNHAKGFITVGVNVREGYEYFDQYLWGIGPQDGNGYFLHRLLLPVDFRWNQHFRIFTELESSHITGRQGGPRPVQDLNKAVVNQLFGEWAMQAGRETGLKLRAGKQSLHYGQGTLLDIRDANVRRSFAGGKLIFTHRYWKADAFFMWPMVLREGFFDDAIDRTQQVGGLWTTRRFLQTVLNRLDLYYIFIRRDQTRFNQGTGKEVRHTIGWSATLQKGNWFSYSEMEVQFGRFGEGSIRAWKVAPSLGYQCKSIAGKPILSIQGAISSGDKDVKDMNLQTFSPLYPKAIYYGFIDNAGSANLVVVHPKMEVQIAKPVKLTVGHYWFWRQQTADGLYAINGAYLLPAVAESKPVGSIWDLSVVYQAGSHFSFQAIGSYYQRKDYLKELPATRGDVRYLGVKATLRI